MATAIAQSAPGIPPAPVGIIRNGSARKAYEKSERAAEEVRAGGRMEAYWLLDLPYNA